MSKSTIYHIVIFLICSNGLLRCNFNKKDKGTDNPAKVQNDTIVNKKNMDTGVNWNEISIEKLPMSSNEINSDTLIHNVLTNNKSHPLNDLFSNETVFKIDTHLSLYGYQDVHPNKAQGTFYKRLPNVGDFKVVICSYLDRKTDYKGQTFELQIIDEENKVVDKLIIQDEINYECFWKRTFSINSEYEIKIFDHSGCVADLESDEVVDEKMIETRFNVIADGRILKQSEL